jgi:SAM-dependent methyltransferase
VCDDAENDGTDGAESPGLLSGQAAVPSEDVTLRSYERGADLYREACTAPVPEYTTFLDMFAGLVSEGEVLEVGSGTGRDAIYLRRHGLQVTPSDGARAFVEMMRDQGLPARLLDIRADELGGPYRAVLANAVLLHLNRNDLSAFFERVSRSVTPDGILGFTMKEGEGESWSYAKLGLPRHFTYWREADIRDCLASSGWTVEDLRHVEGDREPWLFVVASCNTAY